MSAEWRSNSTQWSNEQHPPAVDKTVDKTCFPVIQERQPSLLVFILWSREKKKYLEALYSGVRAFIDDSCQAVFQGHIPLDLD